MIVFPREKKQWDTDLEGYSLEAVCSTLSRDSTARVSAIAALIFYRPLF